MSTRRDLLLYLLAGCLVLPGAPAFADDDGGGDDGGGDDHGGGGDDGGGDDGGGGGGDRAGASRARDAVQSGQAASLRDILKMVRARYSGDVVQVGVSGTGGNLVYRIRLIDDQNRRIEVRVDASRKLILGAKFI